MKPGLMLAAAMAGLALALPAKAADYFGARPAHGGAVYAAPPADYLRIGPGYGYDVITQIRPGTAPRLKFCEYQGRWCYGSYGRWDGWFYGGHNRRDRWSFGYWFHD